MSKKINLDLSLNEVLAKVEQLDSEDITHGDFIDMIIVLTDAILSLQKSHSIERDTSKELIEKLRRINENLVTFSLKHTERRKKIFSKLAEQAKILKDKAKEKKAEDVRFKAVTAALNAIFSILVI